MKIKLLSLLLAVMMSIGVTVKAERMLMLNHKDGSYTSTEISKIDNVAFDSGYVIVALKDGSNSSTEMAKLSKISFSNGSGVEETIHNETPMVLISSDILTITGNQPQYSAKIYSVNGTLVASTIVENMGTMSISALSSGVYFLKIDSTTIKFIKR